MSHGVSGDLTLRSLPRLRSDHPLARLAGRVANERFGLDARRLVPRIVAALPPSVLPPEDRQVASIERTGTRIAVARVGRRAGPAAAIVLVPQTRSGERLLRCRATAERRLVADRRLGPWTRFVPGVLAAGRIDGRPYLVETALPGRPAIRRPGDVPADENLLARAGELISELHARTRRTVVVGEIELRAWIRTPATRIRRELRAMTGRDARRPWEGALGALERDLEAALSGRTLAVSWVHGDCWPGNLLLDERDAITGLVDWDRAADGQLPVLDLLHLVVYTTALERRVEPGRIIRDALDDEASIVAAGTILDRAPAWSGLASAERRAALLVYWLRFAAATLAQSDYFARHPRWRGENVDAVLAAAVARPSGADSR